MLLYFVLEADMKMNLLKRFIKDKMFGKTSQSARGVQIAEMADARMGVLV